MMTAAHEQIEAERDALRTQNRELHELLLHHRVSLEATHEYECGTAMQRRCKPCVCAAGPLQNRINAILRAIGVPNVRQDIALGKEICDEVRSHAKDH